MPFYEYTCGNCGQSYIDLRAVEDRNKKAPCPQCGSKDVVRKVSTFAAVSTGPSTSVQSRPCGNSGFS